MSKLFSPDDLRRNGYTRYPRQFLSILIKDYCKDKKSSVKTGIMLYLYSKASYSGYSYMWNGEQYAIKEIHLRTCRGDHQLYKLIYRST